MKRLLLLSLLFSLIPSTKASDSCEFISEYYPDVTIELINRLAGANGIGTVNYKDNPVLNFQTGISNGYGGQYYLIYDLDKDGMKSEELIANGRVISFIGNQLGRGTPYEYQREGQMKIFLSDFGLDYYYSLTNNHKEDEYGRFNLSQEMRAILNASEGFFIPSEKCENFVYYRW